MGFQDCFKKKPKVPGGLPAPGVVQPVPPLPAELLWLLDAPLFIDSVQVEAFYDAVLRPDYEGASLTLADKVNRDVKVGAETTVGAAIPWFTKAEGTLSAESTRSNAHEQEATLNVVSNPYRHLLALAIHYSTEKNNRLVLCRADGTAQAGGVEITGKWTEDDFIEQSPRALLLLDLPPGTKLIPAALELDSGEVVLLFKTFAERLEALEAGAAPDYPGSDATEEQRALYWGWFDNNFKDREATIVIEDATKKNKIAWIDFRMPLVQPSETFLHLHIAPRSGYATGAFAYNFINRTFKHGARIVGTLKCEPDLNVLAIFEK